MPLTRREEYSYFDLFILLSSLRLILNDIKTGMNERVVVTSSKVKNKMLFNGS